MRIDAFTPRLRRALASRLPDQSGLAMRELVFADDVVCALAPSQISLLGVTRLITAQKSAEQLKVLGLS